MPRCFDSSVSAARELSRLRSGGWYSTDSKLRAHFFIVVKSSLLFIEVDIKFFKCFKVIQRENIKTKQ